MSDEKVEIAEVAPKAKPVSLEKLPLPSKKELEERCEGFDANIKAARAKLDEVSKLVDEKMAISLKYRNKINEVRERMQLIKTQREDIKRERTSLQDKRDSAADVFGGKVTQGKKLKSQLKFAKVEDIEEAIRKLELKQQTTSLSLPAEKALVKEIESLRASIRTVAEYQSHLADLGVEKVAREEMTTSIKKKNEQWAEATTLLNQHWEMLKKLQEDRDKESEMIPKLLAEKQELRNSIKANYESIGKHRKEFKAKEDAYYEQLRAVKRARAEERKKQKEAYEKERKAEKEALDAEIALQKPWTAEITKCDVLLARCAQLKPSIEDEEGVEEQKVNEGAFDGGVLRSRDADDTFFLGKKGKGKKAKRRKRQKAPKATALLTHSLDMIDSFEMLGLEPPKTLEDVDASVAALREKREYFDTLPRDAVPVGVRKRRNKRSGPAPEKKEKKPVATPTVTPKLEEAEFPSLPMRDLPEPPAPVEEEEEAEKEEEEAEKEEEAVVEEEEAQESPVIVEKEEGGVSDVDEEEK